MRFTSTRAKTNIESAQAIAMGLSKDGGLFVPESFPKISDSLVDKLIDLDYKGRAFEVLRLYLTDFTDEEIKYCVNGAYENKFDNNIPAPLTQLSDSAFMLELWHGPTCAFKDMALQLLPYLLTKSASKVADGKTMVILVATSGDTGKAALDGFADVENTKIIVFYPEDGVSPMQKLQMTTQMGNNVSVCAIKGNFDDAQTGVKTIFSDEKMKQLLAENNMEFSSANSINFGRLVPQIVYYVSAYCDLVKSGKINKGDSFNVVVPTGNFGNILAAYYAKQMGLPVAKLICASNKNNILTDFINTGVYDRNRDFYTTASPSMDILISSNLERLLFELYNKDETVISGLMADLSSKGKYAISDEVKAKLQAEFAAGCCDDDETKAQIKKLFDSCGYLCDTHTAVAVKVYEDYVAKTGDKTPTVIASTASPYKFAASVLSAVDNENMPESEFDMVDKLSKVTNTDIPTPLAGLKSKEVIHKNVCDKQDMSQFIKQSLNI
ncbi:MAG: threonine synthase [Clostridia bacterium]|nr:threonine synthase [Clostridia bacterium]